MTLSGKVVVMTGASSGIGRAAAKRFAARGARLVLAARRVDALEELATECRVLGGDAVVRQMDVTREAEVQALAELALEQTGSIDVWVNNAGVTLFGSLETAPMAEHRQVIETNLFGAIYGARAVLPIFRRQKRGVLINVGSILSKIGQPFVPSYVISKFGLRGLTEALRAEVADQYDIHVCSLLPFAVDTEHFESGASHVGRDARAMPPVQSPEKVARVLVDLAQRPVRERHVPRVAVFGLALHALFPRTVERILFDALSRFHFSDGAAPSTLGNLYQPQKANGQVHGERPPQLSAATLFAFAAGRFATLQVEFLRAALARARRLPAAAGSSRSPESTARLLHPPT
jgi:NAD(P)-dependent dehydrogenase (short-subunit alcohol dehydrogenase family)